MSIAAMVLGICALVCSFIVPFSGIAIAIVGLVLGVLGQKKAQEVGAPVGMAKAGVIMCIIALAWSVLLTILCATCLAGLGALGSAFDAWSY